MQSFISDKHTCPHETSLCVMFPQWQGETQEFCPNAKVVLVGCKLDMRTDVNTLRELSKQRLIPVTHEQVRSTDLPEGARARLSGKNDIHHNGCGWQGDYRALQ